MTFDLFYAAALLTAILAAILAAVFFLPVSGMKNALKSACRHLESEWKIQGNSTFFLMDGYKLFSNRKLNALWNGYLTSIGNHKGNYRYANIVEYFSPDKTLEETSNTVLASFVPVVLSVAGLLFTSAAYLYYAFFDKVTALMQIEAAVLVLLILLVSLSLAVYYKSIAYNTRLQLQAFARWISSVHETIPSLSEQLADVRYSLHTYSKEQLTFYASLNDHIADNTIKAIEPFLEETRKVIGDFIAATTERQVESMQNLAEYFAGTTTQLYLDQIEKISRTTESMAEIQSRTAETLGSVTTIYTESKDCIQQVGDTSAKVLDRYEDYLSNVRAMNETLSNSVSQLEGLVEYIKNNFRNQNFTIDNLAKFQEELLSVSNQSMNSMQTFFNDFNDQYSSSIISLRAASGDMLKAGELLKVSYAGLAEGVNLEVEQVFHTFEEDLATISVHLSQSIHDLQEAIDELPEILRRINKG